MQAYRGVATALLPLSGAAICGWLLLQPVTGSIADIAASILVCSIWVSFQPLVESAGLEDGLALTLSAPDDRGHRHRILDRRTAVQTAAISVSPGRQSSAIGGFLSAMVVGLIRGQLMGWPVHGLGLLQGPDCPVRVGGRPDGIHDETRYRLIPETCCPATWDLDRSTVPVRSAVVYYAIAICQPLLASNS